MGTLDFLKEFEGRVLDAASYQLLQRNYELQEENNRQLKEKVGWLEKENSALREQANKVLAENDKFKQKLSEQKIEEQFTTYEGFAFKQNTDGKYEPTGYCPNCKVVMSNSIRLIYVCPKCGYNRKCQIKPEYLAKQLNAKSE
jgi:hypothetical protein